MSWSIAAGWPYRCTGMIAAVRGVIAAATAAGSRQKLSGSMSAKTGSAPTSRTALARGGERERRHDDLVAGADAERHAGSAAAPRCRS